MNAVLTSLRESGKAFHEKQNDYSGTWWKGSYKFQRMLANQVKTRFEYFDRIVTDWNDKTVLDLGCGGGYMSEALTKRGVIVTGVDPDTNSLKAASEHAAAHGLKINYRQGIGDSIPLEDNSVDRVVCVDVLEHVQNIGKVISEIRRVIRPGGIFLFDTINRTFTARLMIVILAEDVFRIIPRGAHNYKMFIKPEELKYHLKQNGFSCTDEFVGMGITRMHKNFELEFGLIPSTKVMYLGYARLVK